MPLRSVFKTQQLRRNGIHLDEHFLRDERIRHYFGTGLRACFREANIL